MIDSKSKVLVVDDFELIRMMLQKTLAELGIRNVEEAADGEEAASKLMQASEAGTPFDLVFADWNMPKKTGLELLQFARAHSNYQHTPFIMVTAEAERDLVIQALAAGATDYIIKPISPVGLKKKIEALNKRIGRAAG